MPGLTRDELERLIAMCDLLEDVQRRTCEAMAIPKHYLVDTDHVVGRLSDA